MCGKLRHSMAGEGIALDERRAVLSDSYVPGDETHLRYLLRGVKAHLLGFLPIGNLKANDIRTGNRMLFEGSSLLISTDSQQLTGINVNACSHAAAVNVVHDLVAVADAKECIYNALLLIAQQCCNAAGIDGGRVQLRHRGMLNDNLLENTDALELQQLQEGFRTILPSGGCKAFDPLAAGSLKRLADQLRLAFTKGSQRIGGCFVVDQQPLARNPFSKQRVELRLVVKMMPLRLVVHPADDAVGNASRDNCTALCVIQAVHLCNLVIDVASVIAQGTVEHIA